MAGLQEELKYLQVDRSLISDPAKQADWASKKLVWVPNDEHGFVEASIKGDKNEEYIVEIKDTNKQIRVYKDDVQKMNPPKFSKVEDMAELTCLNEASVLHNLKERYYAGMIYTYSGLFCVVVNPYRRLPIYSEKVVELYKGKKRHEVPPHVYAIADTSYRNMLADREDQSILCTGESGAGKTENTKKVIQYLAFVAASMKSSRASGAPSASQSLQGELEAQLLQANPILESFGNAKTIKNDNSSRFGKFIRINFDNSGYISGANIESYLLEKSRLIRQNPDERSFHIMYQLIAGSSPQLKKDLLLEDLKSYRFMTNGAVSLTGVDDGEMLRETTEAMTIMGMSPEEQASIFRCVSGVLLMGNMQFKTERNTDQAVLPDNTIAQKISKLFGVNVTDFTKAFLRPRIKVGRDYVTKAQTKAQVEFAVEAISKAVYERMFKWLVARINKSLDRTKRQGASFIGILDIAGFEIFEMNSFEQLCINYTNEKLQQLFNHTMFILEQEEYQREGIDWKFIDFGLDLQPTIELLEKPLGVLALLDEECWFPKATDKSFTEKLIAQHGNHPKFEKPEFRSNSDFRVIHYAGAVPYNNTQWLIKNMDPLNENVVSLLQASNDQFMQGIWKDAEIVGLGAAQSADSTFGARTRKGMFRTVGQLYKEQLSKLMVTLRNTNPNFVRCIIPNHEKRAGKIDSHLVLDQLRCNGVLEGIRICRQGFPNRIIFQEFRTRYELLTPNAIPKGFMDGKKCCERMIQALELDPNLYRIGQSKIFFRAGVLAHLEEERDLKLSEIIIRFQAYARGMLARRNYQKRLQQLSAIRILQRNCSAYLKLRNWQWWRLFTKVKPLLPVTSVEEDLKIKEAEMKKLADMAAKREADLQEIERRQQQLISEKNELSEQLQAEREVCQEAEEERAHLATRKRELEDTMVELEARLEDADDHIGRMESDKLQSQKLIRDLEEQLEDEEQQRQKLQLEKVTTESKVKKLEEDLAVFTDNNAKLSKDRKGFEERLAEMTSNLAEEEEKSKGLMKLKTKYEQIIADLEEKLRKEQEARKELEKMRRRLEQEISDLKDQLADRDNQISDLQSALAKRDEELQLSLSSGDDTSQKNNQLQKALREMESELNDVKDDLDTEKKDRQRAEKLRKDLSEELEALKTELEETTETGAVQQQIRLEREQQVEKLKKSLDQESTQKANHISELKQKYGQQVESLNVEIDNFRKNKAALEKVKTHLENENAELDQELKQMSTARNESERKRKQLEAQNMELQARFSETDKNKTDLLEKSTNQQAELEQLRAEYSDADLKANTLGKQVTMLTQQLEDSQGSVQDETKAKLAMQAKLRASEEEKNLLQQDLDEMEDMKLAADKEKAQATQQLADLTKKLDEANKVISGHEKLKDKLSKDLEQKTLMLEEQTAATQKADKYRKKLQVELEDANNALEQQRSNASERERQQRKFDQNLAIQKQEQQKIQEERDLAEKDARDKETKILSLIRELEEMEDQMAEIQRKYSSQKREYDEIVSSKDDVGKSVHDLERAKRALEAQVEEQRQQLEELEDELQLAEDAKMRIEVNLQAKVTQLERDLQNKDDGVEESRKGLLRQLRDMETELEEERRQKTAATGAKKKIESEYAEMEAAVENANKMKEDAQKQYRKMQTIVSQYTTEMEELRASREDAINGSKEADKKYKLLEAELAQLQEELAAAERGKRVAQNERDETGEELAAATMSRNSLMDEKKRLETRVNALEEEMEEEAGNAELSLEKARKLQAQVDQLQLDLGNEKALSNKAESARNQLDKQNKELKLRLSELEDVARRGNKNQVALLESKVSSLEDQLEVEQKERQQQSRLNRRQEKKLRELTMQMDEERRHADQYKEQLEKAQSAKKTVQRDLTEMEEEVSRLNAQRRRLQREFDEATEGLEAGQREISALKSRLRVTDKTSSSRQAPLPGTRSTRSSFLTTTTSTRYVSDDDAASVDESGSIGSTNDDTKHSDA
ncbi:myosin-9-like [Watersipora subatra]|uniref:myosin-9-like n=1 Tax=Watersipora subatra TaxID=2589382 RepID=UPI00355C8B72